MEVLTEIGMAEHRSGREKVCDAIERLGAVGGPQELFLLSEVSSDSGAMMVAKLGGMNRR